MEYEIDIFKDQLIPLTEAPDYLPKRKGKRKHYQTIYRWANKGTKKSGKLASVVVGGIVHTSLEALAHFCQARGEVTSSSEHMNEVEKELQRRGL